MRRRTGVRVVMGLGAVALAAGVAAIVLGLFDPAVVGGLSWVNAGPPVAGVLLILLGGTWSRLDPAPSPLDL